MTWTTATLGEVCDIVSGATPRTSEKKFWGGNILWTTPKDLSELNGAYLARPPRTITEEGLKSCAASLLPENSVLLSSRAPIGLVAINSVPMATNQGFKSLVPDQRRVDSKFLFYWLKSKTSFLQGLGNGATFKEISKAVVERIEIPLPSLDEQRRIAAILDKADALRRKRKRALDLLGEVTRSIFREMFEDSKNRRPSTISEVAERIQIGPFGSILHREDYTADGVPLINPMHIVNGTISPSMNFAVGKEKYKELSLYHLREGDVVLGRRGEMGRCAVVQKAHDGMLCGTGSIFIRPIANRIRPTFLRYLLSSSAAVSHFENAAAGVTMANLNKKIVEDFVFFLPSMTSQKEFEVVLDKVSAGVKSAISSERTINALFYSLQSRAFFGQL